jgi:peptidoglycan-associated lipoprotein
MSLADIYFEFNRFFVHEEAKAALKANAEELKARGLEKIIVEGHCDERGSRDYNLLLGEQRAVAVKDYLEKLGIPGSRIEAVSYGEEKPTCTEHQEGCWRQNRRAHVVAVPKSP